MSNLDIIKNIEKILSKVDIDFAKIKSKNGSGHILAKGNSIEVLKHIPSNSINLIFTDPPYNAGINYGSTYNDSLSLKNYIDQVRNWVSEYQRILKNEGTLYFMNYPELNARILPILEDDFKLKFRRWITWHYPTNIGHSSRNFTRSQRSILFFTKTNEYTFNKVAIMQPYKNPTDKRVRGRISSGSKGRGAYDTLNPYDLAEMINIERADISDEEVQYVNLLKNVSNDRLLKHPCQLPIELIKRLITASTNEGDIVLDPFSGTFTTSLAAGISRRHSLGIEISPNYVKLGQKRLESLNI